VGDDLGVAGGHEAVAERLELGAQLDVVEDLAVLHRPVAAAFARERLVTVGEIDDRQARVDHPEPAVEVHCRAVRPAVMQLAPHIQQQILGCAVPPPIDPSYSTHAASIRRAAALHA
jgi:hypothetical protein